MGHQRGDPGRGTLLYPPDAAASHPLRPKASPVKRNFQFEKRKKDLDKKQKREEKLKKKLERRNQGGEEGATGEDGAGGETSAVSELEPGSSPGDDPAGG